MAGRRRRAAAGRAAAGAAGAPEGDVAEANDARTDGEAEAQERDLAREAALHARQVSQFAPAGEARGSRLRAGAPGLWSALMSPRAEGACEAVARRGPRGAGLVRSVRERPAESTPPANARLPRPEAAGRQAGRRSAQADDAGREGGAARQRQLGQERASTIPRRTSCRRRWPKKLMPDGIGEITRPGDRHDATRRGRLRQRHPEVPGREDAAGDPGAVARGGAARPGRAGRHQLPAGDRPGGDLRSRRCSSRSSRWRRARRARAACSTCWPPSSTSRAIRAGGASRRPTARIRTW